MSKNLNSFVIFIVIAIIGCDSTTTADGTDVIVPLKVGFISITKKTYFNYDPDSVVVDTFKIIGTTVVNGETFYVSNHADTVATRSDGYWTLLNAVPYHYVKYPADVGDIYSSEKIVIQPGDTVVGHWEVLSKDTSITVLAGTYKCYAYERLWTNKTKGKSLSRQLMWWAPNVGLIQYEEYWFNIVGSEYILYHEELLKSVIG